MPEEIKENTTAKTKKLEMNYGISLPKDFVEPLGPMFNFFFLSFIVSGKKVKIDKELSNQMDVALTIISKIVMVRISLVVVFLRNNFRIFAI